MSADITAAAEAPAIFEGPSLSTFTIFSHSLFRPRGLGQPKPSWPFSHNPSPSSHFQMSPFQLVFRVNPSCQEGISRTLLPPQPILLGSHFLKHNSGITSKYCHFNLFGIPHCKLDYLWYKSNIVLDHLWHKYNVESAVFKRIHWLSLPKEAFIVNSYKGNVNKVCKFSSKKFHKTLP